MKKILTIFTLIFLIILSVWYYYQQKITLSVIIPVFNSEKYIKKCLDSIVSQKGDFEIIIVDDGSTDKTPEIIKEYASKYNNIKIITQSNKGVSSARNTGIKTSKSKYITFVDSDDWLEPNAFAKALKIIKQDKSDIILTGYYDVYDREWVRNVKGEKYVNEAPEISKYPTRSLDKLSLFSPFYAKDAYSDLYYIGGGVRGRFFKREFILNTQVTFSQDLECYEDDVFMVSLFLYNPLISVINKPIYDYRNRFNSISKSKNILICGRKSRNTMLNSKKYISSTSQEKILIDDLFISYIFLSISNYTRYKLPFDSIIKEAEVVYNEFNKYNIAEKKSLRNYLKLHNMLLNN